MEYLVIYKKKNLTKPLLNRLNQFREDIHENFASTLTRIMKFAIENLAKTFRTAVLILFMGTWCYCVDKKGSKLP